jgi:oligosaccharide repeat unit polymerase
MNIFVLNLIPYIIWFCRTIYKEKKITIYSFLLLFYLVIAFLGFYIVSNGIYFDVFGKQSISRLTFEPYLYCFVTYFVLFSPLKNLKFEFTNISFHFFKKASLFIRIWTIYFALYTILKLSEAAASITSGLGNAYEARHIEGDTLFVYNNFLLDKFNGYGFFLLDATVPFIMSYVFLGLYTKYLSNRRATFLIFLCFLPSVLSGIAMGSRGGLFMTAFCFMFFVLIFWKYIPKSFLVRIYRSMGVFMTVIMAYSWMITSDRVGKGSEGFNSVLRYFGESFPNLGFLFWNKVENHPMGNRLFPNLFKKNESYSFISVDDSYQYWENKTGVPVLNFKTYFGDLYIEFGVINAIVFVLLCTIIVKKYFKAKKVDVFNLSLLYFYFQICVFAFAGFTKVGHQAFFQLIITLIVFWALKFYYRGSLVQNIKVSI